MRRSPSRIALGLTVGAGALLPFVGTEARETLGALVAVVAAVLAGIGVRKNTEAGSRRLWLVIYLGMLGLVVGILIRGVHAELAGVDFPFPSPADAPTLAGYVMILVGEILLVRARRVDENRADLLDALLVAMLVAIPFWALGLAPLILDPGVDLEIRILDGFYSGVMIAMIAATARLAVGPGLRNRSYYLLAVSIMILFAIDTSAILNDAGIDGPLHVVSHFWQFGFIAFAAATLRPELARLTDRSDPVVERLTFRRTALLTASILIVPCILLWQVVADQSIGILVTACGSGVIALLVLARMTGLVRMNERTADIERIRSETGEALVGATGIGSVHAAIASGVLALVHDDGSASAAILVPLENHAGFTVSHSQGCEPPLPGDRLELDLSSLAAQAGDRGATASCPLLRPVVRQLGRDDRGRSVAVAPFVVNEELRGLAYVQTDECVDRETELAIESLAREASLALYSAELREDLARQKGERRFKALFENSSDVVSIVGPNREVMFCSPAVQRILGRRPESLIGRPPFEIVHPDDRWRARAVLEAPTDRNAAADPLEMRLMHADGSYRWFEVLTRDLRDQEEIQGIVVNSREITDRKGAEQRLANSEARFRALVQNSSDVVAVVDEDGIFTYVSPAINRMLGYRSDELVGTTALSLLPVDEAARAEAFRRDLTSDTFPQASIEVRLPDREGAWHTVDITITDLRREPAVRGIVLNARDVTVRKELEHDLRHQALHDTLTGLGNRAMFTNRVTEALDRGSERLDAVSVLFVDLDDFKTVNDSLGHAVGDQLLIVAAERLRECLRVTDTAARLGGDEFAVLLEYAYGQSEVIQVAERILESLRAPITIGGREIVVTASVGIAMNADRSTSAEVLLRNADMAMYLAKDRGKARYEVFEDEMHASVFERLELKAALTRAIEAEELSLHFQPIISLGSGRVSGVEALVRWEHPERGLLGPGHFIPLAEETGLIVPLGSWVLRAACEQLASWRRTLPGADAMTMSVNLSVRQLETETIVHEVVEALESNGLPPGCLTLEITESLLVEETSMTQTRLNELRAVGVSLAVDDFGTGYSSLGYLQRFPIDIIKIDRSFVDGLGEPGPDPGVVRAIIDLAQRIGARTVAEGIEGAKQLAELKALGCDCGQGYFFARPLPAEELETQLADSASQGDVRLRLEEAEAV